MRSLTILTVRVFIILYIKGLLISDYSITYHINISLQVVMNSFSKFDYLNEVLYFIPILHFGLLFYINKCIAICRVIYDFGN